MNDQNKMNFPEKIVKYLKNESYYADDIGRSDSSVLVFSDCVLKIEKTSELSDGEHEMLLWLDGKLPAPRVIAFERENGFNYLLMTKLDGKMACNCDFSEEEVSRMLAEGLRWLWKTDISDCPKRYDWERKLAEAETKLKNGSFQGLVPQHKEFSDFESLLAYLSEHKPKEEFVFSHGDYCLPNVFLSQEGVCGFLDLGRAGSADIYEDIYMCLWSMRYNFVTLGGMEESRFVKCKEIFFRTLDIAEDFEKLRLYALMDEFEV